MKTENVILLVAVLGVGAYVAYTVSKNKPQPIQYIPTPQPTGTGTSIGDILGGVADLYEVIFKD